MDITSATQPYAKHFIPLESDPPVLNDLMYGLGVSDCLAFTDVWSIDDPVTGEIKGEEMIWIRQTIDNACGLYAILHATCNPETREFIGTWSIAIRELLH